MTILKIKGEEFELKFSVILDQMLNKHVVISDEKENKKGREKLSGGIQKVLPELIDMDIEMLAEVFNIAIKYCSKDTNKLTFKPNINDILEAIEEQMDEDGEAAIIFNEVFEAIDRSAFSRNELAKYVENMQLVKYMKSEDMSQETAQMMLDRMNKSYKKITGKPLFPTETTD